VHTLSGLHNKRQLGVDAVGILLALLLGGHCDCWATGGRRLVVWVMRCWRLNMKKVAELEVLAV
jgi:hypothetical protein